jgi:DNA invertase Pin-like site-specific DNA recombinase
LVNPRGDPGVTPTTDSRPRQTRGRSRRRTQDAPPRALLYVRVSTDEQAQSGLSLEAQTTTLRAEAERRGWEVADVLVDEVSAKRGNTRPAFNDARARLAAGEANVLVASRLDRLSRSVVDFANLMAAAHDEGWKLVALDLGLDTSTTTGRMTAHILAAVAEAEREVIGQRTSAALLAKRARGEHVGRRTTLPPTVIARIQAARSAGSTYTAIADQLNADGVPTGQGGSRWYPSTVRAVALSQAAEGMSQPSGT